MNFAFGEAPRWFNNWVLNTNIISELHDIEQYYMYPYNSKVNDLVYRSSTFFNNVDGISAWVYKDKLYIELNEQDPRWFIEMLKN